MVPAGYAWLAQLPLTAHGKLDRERLQALAPAPTASPGTDAAHLGDSGSRQPQTAVEKAIAAVLSELLDIESIGLDENFFLLGGHSMLGAQLIVRLEDLFGAEISLRFLFDHPTLAQIADEVDRQAAGQAVS
jgi:acyl carrier protein